MTHVNLLLANGREKIPLRICSNGAKFKIATALRSPALAETAS